MQTWFRNIPPYAHVDEPITVEVMSREAHAHIALHVVSSSGVPVSTHYAGHRTLEGFNLWTWATDRIPSADIYDVIVTVAGEPVAQSGFWTENLLPEIPEIAEPPDIIITPPSPKSFPLRGIHDRAGADWMLRNGIRGWCTIPVYLNESPAKLNLADYAAAGIRVIVNLRYSYAVDDGGRGTMPGPQLLAAFQYACIQTIKDNPEAWGFCLCNEMNNSREWPQGFSLTPTYYRDFYNSVWRAKPANTRLSPGAIDPYNPGWGDWRLTWWQVLDTIEGADFLALHAYTHGPELHRITHNLQFGDDPLISVYYDLRVIENLLSIVPQQLVTKPRLVTETNHLYKRDGKIGWDADAGEWVTQALHYFAAQEVDGVCLFRFNFDQWKLGDLPNVLEALRQFDPARL